jgi:hypothetical protein
MPTITELLDEVKGLRAVESGLMEQVRKLQGLFDEAIQQRDEARAQVERLSAPVSESEWTRGITFSFATFSRDFNAIVAARKAQEPSPAVVEVLNGN